MDKKCADCRDAERDEAAVGLFVVRDPDTGRLLKKAYLCREHEMMYAQDGYELKKG